MNDAVGLLAISQLVCLVAVAFLYFQVNSLRRAAGKGRRRASRPAAPLQDTAQYDLTTPTAPLAAAGRLARQAYAPAKTQQRLEPARPMPSAVATGQVTFDSGAIAARMAELGVDVPMLARRMRKSEAEVRALLGRQAAGR